MAYTKSTDFLAKDSLLTGNPAKKVKGSEIDTEFNNIATADSDNVKASALGTGVATALAVNVGSAGAPVLFNGAGGTPSSMTGTNITGTAAGLTAGVASAVAVGGITGLGTGVATALAVNVGSAGAPVVNGGALGTPASGNLANCTGYPTQTVMTLGTPQATTSGTSIDFTSIPAGTKQINVMFNAVSTNGTDAIMVQIGDSGGIEATGYSGLFAFQRDNQVPGVQSGTVGFGIYSNAASMVMSGSMTLLLVDSTNNIWAATHQIASTSGNAWVLHGAGGKALTATLDRVRITTVNGTDTFDAGSVNISYI